MPENQGLLRLGSKKAGDRLLCISVLLIKPAEAHSNRTGPNEHGRQWVEGLLLRHSFSRGQRPSLDRYQLCRTVQTRQSQESYSQ